MSDLNQMFAQVWDEQVADRQKRSPSFTPDQYTATGRATAAYGGKRNAQWWLDNGPQMVQDWIDWRAETQWIIPDIAGRPAVEVELNFILPGLDILIKAFIDRVFVTPAGEPVLLDLKTGRTPETPEQLGLYRVGLGLVHGIWCDWGYFWSPGGKGHGQPHNLQRYTPEYFGQLYTEASAGINAGSFLPKPANNCRAWCGVARYCHAVDGPEAKGHDPLAG